MNKSALRAALAACLAVSVSAPVLAATDVSVSPNPTPCTTGNCSFAIDGYTTDTSFTGSNSFFIPAGYLTGTISNTPIDETTKIDFSSITLTGPDNFAQSFAISPGDISSGYLAPVKLSAGTYSLNVAGTSGGNAAFGGNLSFAAVPDGATWMMMVLGIGLVGAALRVRRKPDEDRGPLMTVTF